MEKLFCIAIAWAAWELLCQVAHAYVHQVRWRDHTWLAHLCGCTALGCWFGYQLTDVVLRGVLS